MQFVLVDWSDTVKSHLFLLQAFEMLKIAFCPMRYFILLVTGSTHAWENNQARGWECARFGKQLGAACTRANADPTFAACTSCCNVLEMDLLEWRWLLFQEKNIGITLRRFSKPKVILPTSKWANGGGKTFNFSVLESLESLAPVLV